MIIFIWKAKRKTVFLPDRRQHPAAEAGRQEREYSEQSILIKVVRIIVRGLGEQAAHGRPSDGAERPGRGSERHAARLLLRRADFGDHDLRRAEDACRQCTRVFSTFLASVPSLS
jgi:hypothetical protein